MKNTEVTKTEFFSISADRCLSSLLLTIIFSITFSGLNSLVASAFLVMFFELIFILAFVVCYRHYPLLKYKNNLLVLFFTLWLLAMCLSLAQLFLISDIESFRKLSALARTMTLFVHIAFTWSVANFIYLSELPKKNYFLIMLLSVVFLTIFYIAVYLFEGVSNSHLWFVNPPLAVHIRHIGSVVLVAASISMSLFLSVTDSSYLERAYLFFSIVLAFAFLWWMGGRSSVVAFLIAFFLLSIYLLWAQRLQLKKLIFTSFALLLGFYLADAFAVFEWNGLARLQASIANAVESSVVTDEANNINAQVNSFTTGRSSMWLLSLEALKKSPWLGLGPYGYLFIPERFFGVHPHNFIIQFLVEWGVIGASLCLLLLLYCLKLTLCIFYRYKKQVSDEVLAAAMVILSLSLLGLTDGSYFHSQPLFYLSLAFAFCPLNLMFGVRREDA